jgi:hypothetical protein
MVASGSVVGGDPRELEGWCVGIGNCGVESDKLPGIRFDGCHELSSRGPDQRAHAGRIKSNDRRSPSHPCPKSHICESFDDTTLPRTRWSNHHDPRTSLYTLPIAYTLAKSPSE